MPTIKLRVKENVMARFLQSLKNYTKEEIEIIDEDETFMENKNYLQKELHKINIGTAKFVSHDEVEKTINDILQKYENDLQ